MSARKVLMVLGGEPPKDGLLHWRHEEADLKLAVDSGWLSFRHANLFPDILIGDMDSLGEESRNYHIPKNVKIIEDKNQHQSDFQKAINFLLLETELEEIVILGALGKRTDHLLNNFSLLNRIPNEVTVIIDSEDEWIRRITPHKHLQIKGQEGATISLLPFIPCQSVTTSGLKWNLNGEDLSWNGLTSVSNICSSNLSEISLLSGTLFAIIQK